ncbi:MAG: sulfite oxidase-like oxidoreductase [Armatimonadota bacterium]|nr:sulfite oxidase-like oxidoreductase [Armatimonadota bacterium]MDR7421863.1 sulfite oxidase-like oxidoreductase [Armatimonadota bacterium]MDR7452896.1 sulfite oxidase-like oxidoreductase [Armatimonadota bacterium]MDR7456206.1 sulfite oxidase-like oxidoreductase [Armatimonadota bacterium]MDR7496368.1 sulfite oxidase-like oxidoreductase [Armatimonadota bacterium]
MARDIAARVPPGQYATEKWPVLHYGGIPRFDPTTWDFRVFGLVVEPLRLTYDELRALPEVTITCDVHCVTAWSRLGMTFEGVPVRTVLERAKVRPEAQFVMVHADQGYQTNLPLSYLQADDALLAWRADGQDLTPDHGWPLRLVVPRLYFWKSAKWVRGFELLAKDRPGFWERNGYHMHGDPWKEERYSSPW